jgi:Flavoprotein
MTAGFSQPVLYVIGCAAPPVLGIRALIEAAQARGWDAWLVLTPAAARWLESGISPLTDLTGHPVRSQYGLPGEPGQLPRADALLVAPATGNTINKLAAGISDTLALGLVNEAIASGLPTAVLASLGHDQAHPAFPRSAAALRGAGVKLVLPDRQPSGRTSADGKAGFPWHLGLAALPGPPGGMTPPRAASPSHDGWKAVLDGLRGGE